MSDVVIRREAIQRTAKREHTCYECATAIATGEQYIAEHDLLYGDGWMTYHYHTDCHALVECVRMYVGDDDVCIGRAHVYARDIARDATYSTAKMILRLLRPVERRVRRGA